jgi:type II secretory pathway component PulJ
MLLEMMIAVGFVGALGALVTVSMFQTMQAEARTGTRIKVADQVARASRWVARDGHRADVTDIPDGGSPAYSAAFQWDTGGASMTCAYTVNNATLIRTCNGNSASVATGITGLSFSRTGRLITASFDVASSGDSQNVTMKVLLGGR